MTVPQHPIYLITGDITLVEQRIQQICQSFIGNEPNEHNYSRLYADSDSDPVAEANSFSMFSPTKVVLYLHFDQCPKEKLPLLVDYAESPNPTNVLIIAGEKFPMPARGKKTPMVMLKKHVADNGLVEVLDSKKINLRRYIDQRVNAMGGRIESQAINRLSQFVGQDLAALNLEIQKLICHAGSDRKITVKDIEAVGVFGAEEKVWNFTRALVVQNSNEALRSLYRMLDHGEAPHRILGSITWEIRRLSELQDSMMNKGNVPASWQRTPSRALREAQRLLSEQPMDIHRMLSVLVATNRQFNSSKAGDRRHLESLVLKICHR